MENRSYTVRVGRQPLTDEQIERLREDGDLPDDYRDRSAPASDYVKVEAASDAQAADEALAATVLKFKGETAVIEEHLGNGDYRPLTERTVPA